MKYWIKHRYSQNTYYVPMGQMSAKEAKAVETGCIAGYNIMLSFKTKREYEAKIATLRADGATVILS